MTHLKIEIHTPEPSRRRNFKTNSAHWCRMVQFSFLPHCAVRPITPSRPPFPYHLPPMAFQLVQAAYWLALSIWFGGAVFVAIAAAAVFRSVREQRPVLPHVLAANLEDQHETLLASAVVSGILSSLGIWQSACAAVVLLGASLHFLVADVSSDTNFCVALLRVALAAVAAALVAFDRYVVFPRLAAHRQTYVDHADEPDVANPAKEKFDAEQRRSLTLLMFTVAVLLGLVLFSAAVTPAHAPNQVVLKGSR